eukprot:Lithocolla_globosa_v1_NODE_59_length_7384_cov_30.397053.p2 type:complete len:286 gc:universal NODE_59_length_7384_cov_30.397053:884-27(-)
MKISPDAKHFVILSVSIALFDMGTDLAFAIQLRGLLQFDNSLSPFYVASIFFFFFPILLNSGASLITFLRIRNEPQFAEVFFTSVGTTTAVVLLSCLNMKCFFLIYSGIFNWNGFSHTVDLERTSLIYKASTISNVFEDLPQLIIQIVFLTVAPASTITIVSIVMSSLSILYGLMIRFLVVLVDKRMDQGMDPPEDNELNMMDNFMRTASKSSNTLAMTSLRKHAKGDRSANSLPDYYSHSHPPETFPDEKVSQTQRSSSSLQTYSIEEQELEKIGDDTGDHSTT